MSVSNQNNNKSIDTEAFQSLEQAGFRKEFSTKKHLQPGRQSKNTWLSLNVIKPFDIVETTVFLTRRRYN